MHTLCYTLQQDSLIHTTDAYCVAFMRMVGKIDENVRKHSDQKYTVVVLNFIEAFLFSGNDCESPSPTPSEEAYPLKHSRLNGKPSGIPVSDFIDMSVWKK